MTKLMEFTENNMRRCFMDIDIIHSAKHTIRNYPGKIVVARQNPNERFDLYSATHDKIMLSFNADDKIKLIKELMQGNPQENDYDDDEFIDNRKLVISDRMFDNIDMNSIIDSNLNHGNGLKYNYRNCLSQQMSIKQTNMGDFIEIANTKEKVLIPIVINPYSGKISRITFPDTINDDMYHIYMKLEAFFHPHLGSEEDYYTHRNAAFNKDIVTIEKDLVVENIPLDIIKISSVSETYSRDVKITDLNEEEGRISIKVSKKDRG